MNLPEVLIHINDKPSESEKNKLVEQLRLLDGVIAPRFSEEKEHLLFVSYNLNKVKENGFKAQLVGL